MIDPSVLDALLAAGASREMIVAAVKADMAIEEQRNADRRSKAREKKRRQRDQSRPVPICPGDREGQLGTDGDRVPPKENPHTPKEITPSRTLASLGNIRVREAFDRLVEIYPKRAGGDPRKPAFQRFERIVRSGVDPEAIVSGAAEYARWIAESRTEPQYVKQLAAWLNAESWLEDWAAKPRPGRGPPRSSSNGFTAILDRMDERENGRDHKHTGQPAGDRGEPGFFDPAGGALQPSGTWAKG